MITRNPNLPLFVRLALRELRGGLSGFRIFIACLFLGVTAIASVGSLTRSIQDSLDNEGQSLLGGDLELRLFQRQIPDTAHEIIAAHGDVAASSQLRTMARVEGTGQSRLVELRGVDELYPLYGALETSPQLDNKSLFDLRGDRFGAVVDPLLARRLKVELGDTLVFGSVRAEIRAFIEREPDKANQGFQLGPSVLIRNKALKESGLVTTGSLVNYAYKLRITDDTPVKAIRKELKETFPDEKWRVRDAKTSALGLRRTIEQVGGFMVVVGLASLIAGGVGVGNAVKGYMDRKTRTIATLKILGADGATIFKSYFLQVFVIGVIATLLGLAAGAMLPSFLSQFLPEDIPVEIETRVYPTSLALAAAYGMLITAAFTIWPLGKARDLPAIRLFRTLIAPDRKWPRGIYMLAIFISITSIIALAVGFADNQKLAAGFVGGTAVSMLLLRFISWVIEKAASKAPRPKGALVRMAVANLHRPGNATGAVVLSLGLGLTLFATLALIEGNLSENLNESVSGKAPDFFFVDIQPYQIEDFRNTALSIDGVSSIQSVPSLRGSVKKLNDTPTSEWEIKDKEFSWILRGDRGLSFGPGTHDNSPVVEGKWWEDGYSGPPQISMGKREAEGLGLKIGDTLTINVLGREITAEIVSLRDIDWDSFGFNFVILFDPNTLSGAPYTYYATAKAATQALDPLHDTINERFEGVTIVPVNDILASVSGLVDQIGTTIRAASIVAILAGTFVLAGAIAAGFRQRVYESVILKVVGAVRRQILVAYLLEYLLIGLVAGIVSLGLALIAGYLVVTFVMELEFALQLVPMVLTLTISMIVTILFGLGSSFQALSVRPNTVLRSE